MSATLVAFLLSLGSGTWIYTKFMRTTGNNTKTSLISATICGVIIFIAVRIALSFIM